MSNCYYQTSAASRCSKPQSADSFSNCHHPSSSGSCDRYNCNDQVLAMAYVPIQKFRSLYEPPKGLCVGTIFMELDKPFLGIGGCLR